VYVTEELEELLLVLGGNADSIVDYLDFDEVGVDESANNLYVTSIIGKLNGITLEIQKYLLET